jgi:hypothetical protein
MNALGKIAPVAGLCSFGIALYAAIGRREYVAAGAFFAVFVISAVVMLLSRRDHPSSGSTTQSQRSGDKSVNLQSGRDINIGGGKSGA